jgi:hypothetical protein
MVLTFICLQSFAQTEKGSMYSGAGLSFSYSKSSLKVPGNSISAYSFQDGSLGTFVNLGYFVANNLAIGPGLNVGYSWHKTTGSYSTKYQDLYLGFQPFLRYYFGEQKTKLFIEPSLNIQYSTIVDDQTTFSFGGGAAIGFVYFINQVIGIESSISYKYTHGNQNNTFQNSNDYKQNDHDIVLGIGFKYYFAKKKKE